MDLKTVKSIESYIDNLNITDGYEDIITVEHRSNNPKRDFLFVNKIQGKHIPCNPEVTFKMCTVLAEKLYNGLRIDGSVDMIVSNPSENTVTVVGFAETATALGQIIGNELIRMMHEDGIDVRCNVVCTTREDYGEPTFTFEEEHSHATTHKVYGDFGKSRFVVFIDDELSTGNTIINCINTYENHFNKDKKNITNYSVVSVCNWQSQENIERFNEYGIKTYSILSGNLRDTKAKLSDFVDDDGKDSFYFKDSQVEYLAENNAKNYEYPTLRVLNSKLKCGNKKSLKAIYEELVHICNGEVNTVRIIGTEEYMTVPISFGKYLSEEHNVAVLCHATTRSKIDVMKDMSVNVMDGISSRLDLPSAYEDGRKTFLYNTEKYSDTTILMTNSKNKEQVDKLISKLVENTNCKNFVVIEGLD